MELVRAVYRSLKRVPGVGTFLVFVRQTYLSSFLYRRVLFKRDFAKAKATLETLFGSDKKVLECLNECVASPVFQIKYSYGHSGDFDVLMLYALTRYMKPEVVVETGVASGRSSTAVLSAMKENNTGTLYSIDLPQFYAESPSLFVTHEGNHELSGFVPEGKQPGWIVPDELRTRWSPIWGDAKKELPLLVEKLSAIDIFYHDSDHSEDHMQFEFRTVYPKIKEGGIILSDDVGWNAAWKNFLTESHAKSVGVYRNFGIAQK